MRFGNSINILPFHNPVRLAAEAAMLDNLACGRFDFGIGRGVRPREFGGFGLNFDEGAAMTDEAIEGLLKAWTQERFAHSGHYWQIPELSLRSRVYQRPHPPLHDEFSDERLRGLTSRTWGGCTYDELDRLGGILIGAPDAVVARVEQLEAAGVDTLLLVCSFGHLTYEDVCRSLELFAEVVIRPRVRRR